VSTFICYFYLISLWYLVNNRYFVQGLVAFNINDNSQYFRKYVQKNMKYLLKQCPELTCHLEGSLGILKCFTFLFVVCL
jgi:hypothetical protein